MTTDTVRRSVRNTVSLLLTGAISFGGAMLLLMQEGTMPSVVQFWCAGITAAILMGNDLKSRLTPTGTEEPRHG